MNANDIIQFTLTGVAVIGLVVTVVFNIHALRASRQQTVATTYLGLNQRMQETLYEILQEDHDALKKVDLAQVQKFRFFQLIDVFADLYQLLPMLREHDPSFADISVNRVRRIAKKPAVQTAWKRQFRKNSEIFAQDFARFMNGLCSGTEAAAVETRSPAVGAAVAGCNEAGSPVSRL